MNSELVLDILNQLTDLLDDVEANPPELKHLVTNVRNIRDGLSDNLRLSQLVAGLDVVSLVADNEAEQA